MDTFNFESLNLKKVKKAIDIGCGNGRHLKSLGFRLKKAEIFGVDQLEHEIHKLNNEFDRIILIEKLFIGQRIRDLLITADKNFVLMALERPNQIGILKTE